MIHKLVFIRSVGRLKSCNSPFENWDGTFKKNVIVYGENRSGKTTFSQILKSLNSSDYLIAKKKTFNAESEPEILLLDDNKKPLKYEKGRWVTKNNQIRVFDIYFIEENLYSGFIALDDNKEKLFEIIIGQEGIKLKNELIRITDMRQQLILERRKVRALMRRLKEEGKFIAKEELEKEWKRYSLKIKPLNDEIQQLNKQLGTYSKDIFSIHIEKINYYLEIFAPDIKLQKFSKANHMRQLVTFKIIVNNNIVSFTKDEKHNNAKYVLSEGDRNALALAFFFAKLEMENELENKIIVFDDPISSFDYSRKNITINLLYRLSQKVNQLFILTHDLNFANECSKKFSSSDTLEIKIYYNHTTSTFTGIDLSKELLTGVFKDLQVVENYLSNGASNDLEKREVIRCIRPILEGYLRIKYYKYISANEWLGDLIKKIRLSNDSSQLNRLKQYLNDLEDLNDYSKSSHHSMPNYQESTISDEELRFYIKKLDDLLVNI